MKYRPFLKLISVLVAAGFFYFSTLTFALGSETLLLRSEPAVSNADNIQADLPAESKSEEGNIENYHDYVEEEGTAEKKPEIADPLEPFNRVMFHFNDKLYFWLLKPVAQGYSAVVPERVRASIRNFFSNLASPIRIVSCLLQLNFSGTATEVGRTAVNTIWGIGGLLEPSSGKELNLQKQDVDLGQTLGIYGLGQGFYIVWPMLGPSSARDTLGLAGDYFLYPVSYLNPWYASTGVRGYEAVNDTSLRIGDYESFKQAAIDPYLALRDAYVQYRQNKVDKIAHKSDQTIPAGKPFSQPKPLSVTTGGLNTAIGYWYYEDKFKDDAEYIIRQNQIYSHVGYGNPRYWQVYARIGVSDLKIGNAFSSMDSTTVSSKNDFEADWEVFGSLGVKGLYPVNETFGISAFVQGSYSFSNFKDNVWGTHNGVPFTAELTVKNLWDINLGVGLQAKLPHDINLYIGPYVYYSEAKASLPDNITDLEFMAGDATIRNKTRIGGFTEMEVPLAKGFRLNLKGQYSERFSAGLAVDYNY